MKHLRAISCLFHLFKHVIYYHSIDGLKQACFFNVIRLNWVLVIAGILPLWAALFIVFTNMRVLKDETSSNNNGPVEKEKSSDVELIDAPEEKKESESIFSGLLGGIKKDEDKRKKDEGGDELEFKEDPLMVEKPSLGLPKGLKRLWGIAFLLIFLASLAYGAENGLAYLFKEYRWVIGTTNPWTSQLRAASVYSAAAAGVSVMLATLRTGIYLIRG